LAGGNPTLYAYVDNTMLHIDPFGLASTSLIDRQLIKEFLGLFKKSGGTYIFPDVNAGGGAWYVGKTNNFYSRLTSHLRSGKLDPSVLDQIGIINNPNAASHADLFIGEANTIAEFNKQGVSTSNKIDSPGEKLKGGCP
jgi:hypothetical protein